MIKIKQYCFLLFMLLPFIAEAQVDSSNLEEELEVPMPASIKPLEKKAGDVKKQMEQKAKEEYISRRKQVPGEINLLPLFEAIPAPESRLPTAHKIDVDAYYDPFIERMKTFQKQIEEETRKLSNIMKEYDKNGQQGVEKKFRMEAERNFLVKDMGGVKKIEQMSESQRKAAATESLNNNPVIAGMGGVENIQKMSESERKAAAMKAIQQNPYATMSKQDPVLAAFMQKMQSDPQYAARYNKMSMNQQMEEYRKFSLEVSGKEPPHKDTEKNRKEFEQQMRHQTATKEIIAYQQMAERYTRRLEQYMVPVNELAVSSEQMLEKLRATAQGKQGYLEVAMAEAKVYAMLWDLQKNAVKYAMGEFNDYIGERWGSKNLSNNVLLDLNLMIGAGINNIYEGLKNFAGDAKRQTGTNKAKYHYYLNNMW